MRSETPKSGLNNNLFYPSIRELRMNNHPVMDAILQCIATGPELSKNISQSEARTAMELILERQVDPVQAGIFLIALRMKRETDAENLGILEAIRNTTKTVTAPVDEVVDIADPYNGYNRSLPCSPFLPVLLATLGIPAVCHGLETVAPKYGITHRQVLRATGVDVDLCPQAAAERLGHPNIGWVYIDQKSYCPKLHALVALRALIVKRPVITTVESMIGPIRGRHKTHLITGYVHKAYPRIYALLARHAGFDSALIVRGVEGSVVPSLRQEGRCVDYHDLGPEQSLRTQPQDLSIEQLVLATPLTSSLETAAEAAAEAGLAALNGAPGPTRDGLVYSTALCLYHLRRYNHLATAAKAAREALDSGKVLNRFKVSVHSAGYASRPDT